MNIKPQQKRLTVVMRNLPKNSATCWLSDATLDIDFASWAVDGQLHDRTPQGRLQTMKPVLQLPIDITRQTDVEKVRALVRGLLVRHRHLPRVGIISHKPIIEALRPIGRDFDTRVRRTSYFGSGDERALNSWHQECDLLVVAGTPRVPPQVVRECLCRFGQFDAAARDGHWGKVSWRGRTESGNYRVVEGRGYADPDWVKAHRSLVRAALIQAAGRGRGCSDAGCEVLVLSTEEAGFTLSNQPEVKPISDTELALLQELSELALIRTLIGATSVTAQTLSYRLGISDRQVRNVLGALERVGLVQRIGQRGGWLPIAW